MARTFPESSLFECCIQGCPEITLSATAYFGTTCVDIQKTKIEILIQGPSIILRRTRKDSGKPVEIRFDAVHLNWALNSLRSCPVCDSEAPTIALGATTSGIGDKEFHYVHLFRGDDVLCVEVDARCEPFETLLIDLKSFSRAVELLNRISEEVRSC